VDLPIEEYLKPTPSIDCGAKSIKEKAQALTKGQEQTAEKARSLFILSGMRLNTTCIHHFIFLNTTGQTQF